MPDLVSVVPPTMPEVLPSGTEVDRYVIDSVLRDGGMATIYLGHHRATSARVAIKILHTEYVHQPDFVARFDREAQVMGRLSGCPQIVSVHDVGALPDGRHYLVMDLVRGHDLRDELDQLAGREETMDLPRALSLMRDVAAGLAAAHHADVVHRDVKPSNVMLESSAGREVAKLLDFGISADLAESGRRQDLTAGGTVIGTARYMAPEQAAGISNSPTVDIWAMGVVLLEMLSGKAPPKRGWGLAGASLDALPPVPGSLRTLLEQMLATDSTQRIQSAREVERRLLEILPSVGVDVSGVSTPIVPMLEAPRVSPNADKGGTAVVPPPASAPSPRRGARPLLWGVAAGVLASGAVAGWWLVRTMTQPDATPAAQEPAVAVANDQTEQAERPEHKGETPPAVVTPQPEPAPEAEPEPAPAPAPEAEAEPELAPEPEPAPKPSSKRPKARSAAAPKKTKDCASVMQETRDAAAEGEWKTVLAHTKRKACWTSAKTERERHRVRALHKLGRYAQCEKEGQESGDPTVWSVVDLCRKAAEKK